MLHYTEYVLQILILLFFFHIQNSKSHFLFICTDAANICQWFHPIESNFFQKNFH